MSLVGGSVHGESLLERGRSKAGKFFDAAGWLVFFTWVVLAFLFKPFPEGVGSIGVGLIVFTVALVRRLTGHTISFPWLFIGVAFIFAGLGTLAGLDFPFLAIALILCGILMLTNNKAHKH